MKELRIRPTDLMKDLQLPRQSFYNILRRPTIDTGLLYRISEKMKYNFLLDLISRKELHELFSKTKFITPQEVEDLKKENDELIKEVLEIRKQLDETRIKYIALLEKKGSAANVKVNGHS